MTPWRDVIPAVPGSTIGRYGRLTNTLPTKGQEVTDSVPQLKLTITGAQAAQYREFAAASPLTLQGVHASFHKMLKDCEEHPFRNELPGEFRGLLEHLKSIPEFNCERLRVQDADLLKGWLIHNGVLIGFVFGYYDAMGEKA